MLKRYIVVFHMVMYMLAFDVNALLTFGFSTLLGYVICDAIYDVDRSRRDAAGNFGMLFHGM